DKEFEKEVVEILESLKSDEYIESEQAKSFLVVKEKLITDSSFIHQLEMQFFTILRQIIEKQHFPESIEMISNAAFEKMFSKVLQEQSFFAQQFLPDYLKNSYSRIAFLEFFSPRFLQDALSNFTTKSHFEKIGNLPEEILNIAKAILNLIKDKPIIDLEYISKSINFSLFELILSSKIETITKSELVQVLLKSSLDAIKTKSTKILLLPEKEDFDKMLKDFPDISFQLINELSIKKSVSEDILSSLSDRTDIVNIKDVFTSSTEFLTALSVYFLKYGNIPWWCPEEIKPEDALHQLLKLINSGKIQKLTDFEKIFKTRIAVQRMTEFLDYESIFSLLSVSGLYESKSMVLKFSKLLQKYFATKTALTSPNEILLVILNYLISLSGTFKSDDEKEILARVIEYFSEIEALESSKIIDGIVDFQHKEGSESKIEAELKNDLILLRNDFDEAKDYQSKLDFLKSYKKINSLKQVKEFSDILKFLLEFESISEIELQTIISIFKKHLQELQNDEKNQLAKVLVDAITDSKIAEEIKTFYQEITEKSKILKQFEVLKSIDSLDSKSDIAGFTKEFQKFIQYINLTKLEKFDVFSLIKEHFLSLLDKGYIEIANVWLDALKRFDSESQNKLIQEWIKKFSSRRSIDKKIENKLIGHISDSIKAVGKDSLILFKISEPIKSLTISFESFFADFHKEILPKGKFSPSNIKKLLEIKLWSLFTDDKISKKIDKQIIFEILDFIFSKSFETKDYQIIIRFSDFNNVIISLLKRHFPTSLSGSDFQEISNLLVGHFSDSLKMFEKSEPIKSLFISFESFFEDFYKKFIPESKFQQSNIKRLLETKLSSLFIKQKIEHEIKDETKHEIYESFFKKIDKQIILEILEFIFSKSFETKHYQIVIRHSDFDNIIILLLKSNFSSSLSANDFKQISNSLFKYFEDNITLTEDVSKRTDKIPDNELSEIREKDIHDDLVNKSMISKVSEPLTETEKNKYPSVKEVVEDDDIKNLIEKMTDDEIYHKIIKQRYDWLDKQDKDGKYYVQNAGLVIFYPFLKTFFNRMKLLNEKFEFIGFSEKEKAVHLLQYIATGEDIHPEYLLVLNKIFCGLDISFPVRLDVELTVEDKNECDLLFKSVIVHWEIVKNSTIPSVRETFIQRDGVLVKQNGNWNLKVEQKGFDVLVQKIPWGFSTMKFSWTKYIIFVEWT
ncbi:MAG: hypothetical protein K9J13_13790, partial [Saprospiraceae bacterium]|nr:hypothetical protein [Saprospiraceae bacterium]